MPRLESVVRCDPDVLGGTPVLAGTRLPVKNLLDYLAAGDSLERFPRPLSLCHAGTSGRGARHCQGFADVACDFCSMNRCLDRWLTCS